MSAHPQTAAVVGRRGIRARAVAAVLLPALPALVLLLPGPAFATDPDPAVPAAPEIAAGVTPPEEPAKPNDKPVDAAGGAAAEHTWEDEVPFKPVFYLGTTFSKSGEDFSRKDTYYAVTVDVNAGSNENKKNGARQFLQFDLRFTPVVQSQDGQEVVSDKKAGYFAFQWYDEVHYGWLPGNKRCGKPPDGKTSEEPGCGSLLFDRFSSLGFLAGVVSEPDSQKVPHFLAPMYRGTIMEPRGPNEAPNVYGYYLIAPGWWTNYEHKRRVFVEGRFQIARTPLVAGVEANVGAGASDFKFLLAAKVEPGKLFKGLGIEP